jgi:hypothetical protein
MLPYQLGQMDADCSRDVHRHVHTPVGLDALGIDKVGGAAVQPVGEVDTRDGLAWRGHNC